MLNCFAAKLGNLPEALESFEQALELSRLLGDKTTEKGVIRAIKDIDNRLANGNY